MTDPLNLARELIDAGIPVIVCRPNPYYLKPYPAGHRRQGQIDKRELLLPTGWNRVTAAQCNLDQFRPGIDVLALVGGHGVDVVDVDTKDGGTVDNLPPFEYFGVHSTPSNGRHFLVRSTGYGKLSPFGTSLGHVGDYVGGTRQDGSRLLAFLPGSTRPKYPGKTYEVLEPLDLETLLDSEPDANLIAALEGCGASDKGLPGEPPVTDAEVEAFMAEHHEIPAKQCTYGRNALEGMLEESYGLTDGDPKRGRHAWAIKKALRAVELVRDGCMTSADLDKLEDRLSVIKPEEDWQEAVAHALANAKGHSDCGMHSPDAKAKKASVDNYVADLTGSTIIAEAPQDAQEPAVTPFGSSWLPKDLSAVIDGLIDGTLQRPAPTIGHIDGGTALFYAGKVNGVAGESGAGKSWTALVVTAQELTAGHCVLYVDMEDDEAGIVSRLLDLGTNPDDIRARFLYIHPDERLDEVARAMVAAILQRDEPTLVVVDSTGEGLTLEGAKPNADEEVAAWFRRVPRMLADQGAAVVVLDHVTKADDGGLWPIGSQRKRAAINGAQYMQTTVHAFSKDTPGRAALKCAKDRHGSYKAGQRVAELVVDPQGEGRLNASLVAAESSSTPVGEFRPTGYMQRVSDALVLAAGALTYNEIRDRVTGKKEHIRKGLDLLIAEGYVTTQPGPRRAVLHTLEKAFNELDETAGTSRESEQSPTTGPTGPGPKAGDRGPVEMTGPRDQWGTSGGPVEGRGICDTCGDPCPAGCVKCKPCAERVLNLNLARLRDASS